MRITKKQIIQEWEAVIKTMTGEMNIIDPFRVEVRDEVSYIKGYFDAIHLLKQWTEMKPLRGVDKI